MKKLLLTTILGLSICAVNSRFARAQTSQFQTVPVSTARAEIQACYNRYTNAIVTKNINAIGGILAPDYVSYSMEGKQLPRERLLNFYAFLFRLPSKFTRYETRITSIEARDVDWIVMSQTIIEFGNPAARPANYGKAIINCRDYWGPTRHPNHWMLRQTAERSAGMWINGEKIM